MGLVRTAGGGRGSRSESLLGVTGLGHQTLPIWGIQVSKSVAVGGTLQLYSLVPLGFWKKRDSFNTFSLHFSYCLPSGRPYPAGAIPAFPSPPLRGGLPLPRPAVRVLHRAPGLFAGS